MNLHGTGPAQGFWALLTDDERAALTGLGRTAVYPPGTVLCVEGDPATHVFVLVKGWVKIVGVTSDGHELTLALRGRGDTVGGWPARPPATGPPPSRPSARCARWSCRTTSSARSLTP